jgi:sulfur carrier protein ThiS
MNITVEFLSLPNIVKMVGAKTVSLEFTGRTVEDLVHQLAEKYGNRVRQFLFDETGQLDMSLAVVLNQQEWLRPNQLDKRLQAGDRVAIVMLVGGG